MWDSLLIVAFNESVPVAGQPQRTLLDNRSKITAPGATGDLFTRKSSVVSFQLSGEKEKGSSVLLVACRQCVRRLAGRQTAWGTLNMIFPPWVETLSYRCGLAP